MRLRIPRFLKQIISLLLLLSLITSGLNYGIRAAQPMPMCVSFWTHPDRAQINPFSGKVVPDRNLYETTFDYAAHLLSPNGKAVAWIEQPGYAAPHTLWIGATGKTRLRQIDLEQSIEGGWSPDGSAFAYVYPSWEDNYARIAVISPTGTGKRVQALPMLVVGNSDVPSFAGWSADGRYMAVTNGASGVILSADTLQPVPTITTPPPQVYQMSVMPVWSPQGHRFAYVDPATTPFSLVIATPEHEEQRFPLQTPNAGYMYPWLRWSPDGRYVMMAQQVEDAEHTYDGVKWVYWSYNIFGVDGSAHLDLKGQKVTNDPEGWWLDEGATWIFRQQLPKQGVNETDADIFSYLTAYHADTDTEQILADHVAESPLFAADKRWFAAPIWNNGTIEVELNSIDGKMQQRLVTGAILETLPTLAWSESNGGTIAVVWTRMGDAGKPITVLTWAHADGSGQQTLDSNFEAIIDLYWLNDGRSLYFVGQRGERYAAQIVDLDTATILFAYYGLREEVTSPSEEWESIHRVFEAPSGRRLVFIAGTWNDYQLYAADLDSREMRLIRKNITGLGLIYWSPDETTFMFRQSDDEAQVSMLNIVAADGSRQYQIDTPNQYASDIAGWTWCE